MDGLDTSHTPNTNGSGMADRIILLASYPKTGSTWLRRLLIEALVTGGNLGEVIPSFVREFPLESPVFTLRGEPCRVVKTHLHPDHDHYRAAAPDLAGIITIRRHPLDVLLSSLNYAKVRENNDSFIGGVIKSVDDIIADGEMKQYIDQFVAEDGFPWHAAQSDRYSAYQKRWRRRGERIPYYEVCYEDMVADPLTGARALLAFLKLSFGFDDMRRLLRKVDQRTQQDGKFYWSRRAYNFEALLPRELTEYFYDRYAPVLAYYGYGEIPEKSIAQTPAAEAAGALSP